MSLWRVTGTAGSTRAVLRANGAEYQVIVGRGGFKPAASKDEGDWATPLGTWRILYGLYRADRVAKPQGGLAWAAITPDMGWCDAPDDVLYNQPVPVGYPASHERLWREDAAYDYVLVLDHNQGPVAAGKGSAVFVHVWRDGVDHTAGCVALKAADMAQLADSLAAGTRLEITL